MVVVGGDATEPRWPVLGDEEVLLLLLVVVGAGCGVQGVSGGGRRRWSIASVCCFGRVVLVVRGGSPAWTRLA